MRSGIEIVDCSKLRALALPAALSGSPAQSAGFGPAPRSMASSSLIAAQDPDRSTSASAGTAKQIDIAKPRLNLWKVIDCAPLIFLRLPLCRTVGRLPFCIGIARLLLEL